MVLLTNRQIKVNAPMAMALPAHYKAVLYTRLQDENGSGHAIVKIKAASKALGQTAGNVRNMFKKAMELGYIRSMTKLERGIYLVYYTAGFKIAIAEGLDGAGQGFLLGEYQLPHLTTYAIEATLSGGQEQSRWMAEHQKDRSIQRLEDDRIFEWNSSDFGRGKGFILGVGEDRAWVDLDFATYGMTQETAAKRLDISDRTVRRHVSTANREKVNEKAAIEGTPMLSDLDKRQVMRRRKDISRTKFVESQAFCSDFDAVPLLLYGNFVWECCPNVYKSDLELCRFRLASRVRRAMNP